MNRKQKIIVSIAGITIVMLALLGLTYGYYLTNIYGNTNTNSISVTTANLKLVYDDGSSYINLTNIMPGVTTDGVGDNPEPKVFTITNDGSVDVEYSIGMDEITKLSMTNDLKEFEIKDYLNSYDKLLNMIKSISNSKIFVMGLYNNNFLDKTKTIIINSELSNLTKKYDEYFIDMDFLFKNNDYFFNNSSYYYNYRAHKKVAELILNSI